MKFAEPFGDWFSLRICLFRYRRLLFADTEMNTALHEMNTALHEMSLLFTTIMLTNMSAK